MEFSSEDEHPFSVHLKAEGVPGDHVREPIGSSMQKRSQKKEEESVKGSHLGSVKMTYQSKCKIEKEGILLYTYLCLCSRSLAPYERDVDIRSVHVGSTQ